MSSEISLTMIWPDLARAASFDRDAIARMAGELAEKAKDPKIKGIAIVMLADGFGFEIVT